MHSSDRRYELLRRDFIKALGAGVVLGPQCIPSPPVTSQTFDVVIYGGTIAGINAAYCANINGASVALIEPTAHLGGMSGAGGLSFYDISNPVHMGGIFWQQFQQVAVIEGVDTRNGTQWPNIAPPTLTPGAAMFVDQTKPGMMTPQPKNLATVVNGTATGAYNWLGLGTANISIYMNAPLATTAGSVYPSVIMTGQRISALVTSAGIIRGKVFIDASYEGDVLAGAAQQGAATYVYGRESSSQYNEISAGVLLSSVNTVAGGAMQQFPFLPLPAAQNGAADSQVQGYNFRACLQRIANGGNAFTQPAGYNAGMFGMLPGVVTAGGMTQMTQVVGASVCLNNKYCFNDGTSWATMTNQCAGYPDGTPTQRTAIFNAHKLYYQGILYFLANDPSVSAVNADAQTWGLAGDEFTDNGNWPYQLYVREGRRMVGKKIMTQRDIVTSDTPVPHAIGWVNYALDTHAAGAYFTGPTTWVTDGLLFDTSEFSKVTIPMEAIMPNVGQCPNLIVPVCLSASHIAWGPIRMESTLANMGEAAGCMAAAMKTNGLTSTQQINYTSHLLPLLTAIGARLT